MEETKFRSLQILKTESLGRGSFGQVYKARCGDLLCAAKILHPELLTRPGAASELPAKDIHKLPVMRFESECRFMSGIRHPNIVQYLGLWQDPHISPLPVLLMELMDENLTTFLEQDHPLPFHMQVNILQDISLALSFLHSNGIIHRDLSSNNVLMIGDRRAKVTDFGMTMRFSSGSVLQLTENPGTAVYMPPEAHGQNYDNSIDCFSLGVLAIQTITLLYPKPGKDVVPVEGKPSLLKRVPEKERRQSHIELIEHGSPLLRLALDCISDEPGSRPTAQDMCRRIEGLRESGHYSESMRNSDLMRENKELKEQAKAEKHKHTEDLSNLQARHSDDIRRLQGDHAKELKESKDLHEQRLVEIQTQHQTDFDQLRQVIKSKEEEMKFLHHNHNHDIMELKQKHTLELQRVEAEKQKWMKKYKDAKDRLKRLKEQEEEETVKGKSPQRDTRSREGRRSSDIVINWNLRGKPARQPLHREDSEGVYCNDTLYVRLASGRTVLAYHPRLDKWEDMGKCPQKHSTLAHINNTVIAVGGRTDALEYLNCIYYLTKEGDECRWKLMDGFRMPTKRCSPIVVSLGSSLVIAGGEGEESRLRKVEVLDIATSTWSTAADLPESLIFSSAALCEGNVYFLGGEMGYNGVEKQCMFSCSVDDLQRSCTRVRDRKRRNSEPLVNIWKLIRGPPVTRSACVAFRGQLLSIGGKGADRMPTSAVYRFCPETGCWSIISYMCMTRSKCFAVVLPEDETWHRDEVLVVGGNSTSGKTDTIELGTV
jgi:serine/threonine protein kinase